MNFFPEDKVRITLETSEFYDMECKVVTATEGKVKVTIDNKETWFWDDEVELIDRK